MTKCQNEFLESAKINHKECEGALDYFCKYMNAIIRIDPEGIVDLEELKKKSYEPVKKAIIRSCKGCKFMTVD